jgi:hypothetical protein
MSIPYPLSFASWCDQIPLAFIIEYIDWRRIDATGFAALDLDKVVVRQSHTPADKNTEEPIEKPLKRTGFEELSGGVVHAIP